MRKVTPRKYAAGLYEALRDLPPEQVPGAISSFMEIVLKNKDASKFDKIIAAFRSVANEQEGRVEIDVVTAQPLDQSLRDLIGAAMGRALKRDVILRESLEPRLLGGIVVRYGDTIIDGSVRRQLSNLSHALRR